MKAGFPTNFGVGKHVWAGLTLALMACSQQWTPPVFQALTLVNGASDGTITAAEISENKVIVALAGTNFSSSFYSVVGVNENCESSATYAKEVPTASAIPATQDETKKICVRLENGSGRMIYGFSRDIVVDLDGQTAVGAKLPDAPTLQVESLIGLSPIIKGTCDAREGVNHTAQLTSNAGIVRAVTCNQGLLTVELHLPPGLHPVQVRVTSSNSVGEVHSDTVSFVRTAFVCPDGYIGVPASRTPGLGDSIASGTESRWWLNTNKDFCVMKYPAKDEGDKGVSKREGYPLTARPRGNESDGLDYNSDTAMRRCKKNGPNYRLMSNTQWQTIARNAENVAANWTGGVVGSGKLYLGHTDRSPDKALDHSTDNDPYYGTENDANDGSEQKRIKFLTNDEIIWDFGGNVWQMVSDSYSIIKPSPSLPETVLVTFSDPRFFALTHVLNRMLFAPLGEYDREGHNTGDVFIETEADQLNPQPLDVIQRGGSYDSNPVMGGMYATHAAINKPLGQNSGFRCAYLP